MLLPSPPTKPAVVYEPGVVKMTAIEVSPVVPFKERTVVFEVKTIPVVAVPGRIIIVGVSGEVGFYDSRSGKIAICINRRRCGRIGGTVNNGSDNDPGCGNPEADVCANEYLGTCLGSDEAGGYSGGEDK